MRAVRLQKYKVSDSIKIDEIERPSIGECCVLVEVYAASVNPVDYKIRDGYMQLPLPMTLGGDFSGVVIDVGKKALGYVPGDEVYGGASVSRKGSGSLAEYCVADISTIALKSKSINHIEAAAYPLAGISALQGLTEHIRLSRNQKILIHGGAGGIGHLAIQIAKNIGAYVATTVSTEDVDFARDLGADLVINYKEENFEKKVQDFDFVFDTVGSDTYKRSFNVVHKGGVIVSMLAEPDEQMMMQHDINSIHEFTNISTDRLDKLTKLIDDNAIKVRVDKIFNIEQTSDALISLQKDHPKGKIVVKVR